MDGTGFDAIAKRIGVAMTRRRSLKGIVVAMLGSTLLLQSGEESAAKKGGKGKKRGKKGAKAKAARNSACAAFCKEVFGPASARGACISEAAGGGGLCAECDANAARVCVASDGTRRCPNCGAAGVDPATCTCRGGCTPTTCAAQGKNCGNISDGCGSTLSCGSCTAPNTCGGGGTANVCGCPPLTCGPEECGILPDGCGGTRDCGSCPAICAACTPFGAACVSGEQCCSGHCRDEDGTCYYPEQTCRDTGDVCDPEETRGDCCRGSCDAGCCTCLATGEECSQDRACCEGQRCFAEVCCRQIGESCDGHNQCCSGLCEPWYDEGLQCGCGPVGTPCRIFGDCCNDCGDDGFCTCGTEFAYCRTSNPNECCEPFECRLDSSVEAPPFDGLCRPRE
jgi:hypothetical protein